MKNTEILEKLTHVDSEHYEKLTATTLMDRPEFYLELVSKIQEILVKESDSLHDVSDRLTFEYKGTIPNLPKHSITVSKKEAEQMLGKMSQKILELDDILESYS